MSVAITPLFSGPKNRAVIIEVAKPNNIIKTFEIPTRIKSDMNDLIYFFLLSYMEYRQRHYWGERQYLLQN